MKTVKYLIIAAGLALGLTSCKDYLTEIEPGTTLLSDYFTSTPAAEANVIGCYTPLMWEYKNTYFSEWFIGDIVSDDALKGGGSTTDMGDSYDMENWRTTSSNGLLLQYYRAQYQGIGRCNLALQYIADMKVGTDSLFSAEKKNQIMGEAYFLRAYYYFRLLRVFGGVPITTKVVSSSSDWGIERASADELFTRILTDLEMAQASLPEKSAYPDDQTGRATKGAAEAMLMKVNLYMASSYWSKQVSKSRSQCLTDVKYWGKILEQTGEYSLCPNYEDNFTVAGENGPESVFEIQYAEVPWGDYGEGFGYTDGSFTQILCRSRSSLIGGGWGFNHPTQDLYDEFEAGDIRRDVAILVPDESKIETPAQEYYLGNKMLNNKYGMYRDPADIGGGFGKYTLHASRGPLNNKQIRYADVLLMYAEACQESGDEGTARDLVNQLRTRVGLKPLTSLTRNALRHERRCELAMEGHRWFDLVRWEGVEGTGLKAHMDAYKAKESATVQQHIQEFVAGKHELFPIPQDEIQLNPADMKQNPGY